MLGKAFSPSGQLYNVIILAGGNGTRMGDASDYIPKALTQIGGQRAIDLIINRFSGIAHKFIIGTHHHADLLEGYVRGRYGAKVEFSRETALRNNGWSALFCMDHADSNRPTIVTFCDLLMIGNPSIDGDTLYYATQKTEGKIGTFRHTISDSWLITPHETPLILAGEARGIIGQFVFDNTVLLKCKAYEFASSDMLDDLTDDIVCPYFSIRSGHRKMVEVTAAHEFGTADDLQSVRKLWENS